MRYTPSAAQPYSRVSFFRRAERPLGSLVLCECWLLLWLWPWPGLCALGLEFVELGRFWYWCWLFVERGLGRWNGCVYFFGRVRVVLCAVFRENGRRAGLCICARRRVARVGVSQRVRAGVGRRAIVFLRLCGGGFGWLD